MKKTIAFLFLSTSLLCGCTTNMRNIEIDLLQGSTEQIKTETKNTDLTVIYEEWLGDWFYTAYTDYQDESDFEIINIKAINENDAIVTYGDGSMQDINFRNSDYAVSNDIDSYSFDNRAQKRAWKFSYSDEYKTKTLTSYLIYADTYARVPAEAWSGFESLNWLKEIKEKQNAKASSTKKESFMQKYNSLCQKEIPDASQSEMNKESVNIYNLWDELLNEVYKYLKQTMSDSKFQKLKNDEIKWVNEKEKAMNEAEEEYITRDSNGNITSRGTMEILNKYCEGIEYTKERCEYLISLVQ